MTPMRRALAPLGLGLLVALSIGLMLAIAWVGEQGHTLTDLAWYLLTAGLVSLSFGAMGVFWLRRGSGRLWLQMTLTYALGLGIALFNIFLTVRLMFVSSSDLPLLILLLLFAGVISLGLGISLARAIAQRVTALNQGARALAAGDLAARVVPQGSDELAELAREFNQMADQLAAGAAERARQEAARRDLIAAVSHDLRTPLASLRAMTEALSDGLIADPATTARYLSAMGGQIKLLSSLIDDLFELSQIDAGALQLDLQRVSLEDLVSETLMGLQAQADARGVALEGQVEAPTAPVMAAPQKIARVLHNLVSNALRHTPEGGRVTITVLPEQQGPGEAVLVEVADTGEGIAPDDLPHVFDRFYRSEKSRSRVTGGAGLGLAIARGIVEAHGGRIWIASERGRGTQVRFTLPRSL